MLLNLVEFLYLTGCRIVDNCYPLKFTRSLLSRSSIKWQEAKIYPKSRYFFHYPVSVNLTVFIPYTPGYSYPTLCILYFLQSQTNTLYTKSLLFRKKKNTYKTCKSHVKFLSVDNLVNVTYHKFDLGAPRASYYLKLFHFHTSLLAYVS